MGRKVGAASNAWPQGQQQRKVVDGKMPGSASGLQNFRSKHMSPEELEAGYDWVYRRLVSHASIWRRRPEDWQAVAPYLAMSYFYKRSNRTWHWLIKSHLVHTVWRPLVELTRLRHLHYRKRLARLATAHWPSGNVLTAGV